MVPVIGIRITTRSCPTNRAPRNKPTSPTNQTVRSELGSFFLEVQHDATVRCVVFESGERSFWAGADLREYALRFDAAVARAHVDNAHRMMLALVELDTPLNRILKVQFVYPSQFLSGL